MHRRQARDRTRGAAATTTRSPSGQVHQTAARGRSAKQLVDRLLGRRRQFSPSWVVVRARSRQTLRALIAPADAGCDPSRRSLRNRPALSRSSRSPIASSVAAGRSISSSARYRGLDAGRADRVAHRRRAAGPSTRAPRRIRLTALRASAAADVRPPGSSDRDVGERQRQIAGHQARRRRGT